MPGSLDAATQQQGRSGPAEQPPLLSFPPGRTVLRLDEVAKEWLVTRQHISDLIEEFKLDAVDMAGGGSFDLLIAHLSKKMNAPRAKVEAAFLQARAEVRSKRKHWRVPKAAYMDFLQVNHSRRG